MNNCEEFIKLIKNAVSAPRADNSKIEFGYFPISIPTSEQKPFNLETAQTSFDGDLIPMSAKNDNCAIQVIGYILTVLRIFSGKVCEGDIGRAKRLMTDHFRVSSDELTRILDFYKVNYQIYEIYDEEMFIFSRISNQYSITITEKPYPNSPEFIIVLAAGHYDILCEPPMPI